MPAISPLTPELAHAVLKMYVEDFLDQWQTCACHWHLARSLVELNRNKNEVTADDFMLIESLRMSFNKKYPETQFHLWPLANLPDHKKIREIFWYLCLGDSPHILPVLLETLEKEKIAPSEENALKTIQPFLNIMNPFRELPEIKLTSKGVIVNEKNKKHKKFIETQILNHITILNQSNT
jgi:hypothetical protein